MSSYEGKRVLVTGGGGAGMGAATAKELIELGAEVHVFDLKEPPSGVAGHLAVDLRDEASVEDAIREVISAGPIQALFNCAGLPGPPFSETDVVIVNFAAARKITTEVAATMSPGGAVVTISSAGAFGWEKVRAQIEGLLGTAGYDEVEAWCDENSQLVGEGYLLSKQAIIWWTMEAAMDLAQRGVRVNCTSPGPTATPMMPAFEQNMGKSFMDKVPKPLWGRNSTPEEQAHVLVFLNSDQAAYVTGTNVWTDGGFCAGMLTGRLDFSALVEEAQ